MVANNCRRAVGPNLCIEERSVETTLRNASLCISFAPAIVIPGTRFFTTDRTLIMIVPTQSVLHRFSFDLSNFIAEPDFKVKTYIFKFNVKARLLDAARKIRSLIRIKIYVPTFILFWHLAWSVLQ